MTRYAAIKAHLRRKLQRQTGFSLIEMLAAAIVLILLSLMLLTGLNLAVDGYRKMTAEAETEVLLSSLVNVVSEELRFARNVAVETGSGAGSSGTGTGTGGTGTGSGTGTGTGDTGTGTDTDTGAGASGTSARVMSYTSNTYGSNTKLSVNSDGQLLAGDKKMLAAGAYGNGDYQITEFACLYDKEAGIFTVTIRVEGIEEIAAETTVEVRCLNAESG